MPKHRVYGQEHLITMQSIHAHRNVRVSSASAYQQHAAQRDNSMSYTNFVCRKMADSQSSATSAAANLSCNRRLSGTLWNRYLQRGTRDDLIRSCWAFKLAVSTQKMRNSTRSKILFNRAAVELRTLQGWKKHCGLMIVVNFVVNPKYHPP